MLKICICDDEPLLCNKLKELLLSYAIQNNIDFDFLVINDVEELLRTDEHYDILFLDIRFGDSDDGIMAAIKLREMQNDCFLIYLTSLPGYMQDSFKANAYRYLVKPINTKMLYEALDDVRNQINKEEQNKKRVYFSLVGGSSVYLGINDLIVIRSVPSKRIRVIECKKGEFVTRENIKTIYERLPQKYFGYVHQSYIVNLNRVSIISKSNIIMTNGTVVPVGRTYRGDFLEKIQSYVGGHIDS